MNIDPDTFLSLIEAVENQGGAHLSERHVPRSFKIRLPAPGSMDMRVKELFRTGCNREALFLVPYDPAEEVTIRSYDKDAPHGSGPSVTVPADSGEGMAKVCAVDDNVAMWPRFKGAI